LLAIILFLLQSDSKTFVYPTTTCTIPFFNSFSQWNWQKVFEVTYTKNPPQQTHRQTTHKMIAFTALQALQALQGVGTQEEEEEEEEEEE
jgi:hypothetical protein